MTIDNHIDPPLVTIGIPTYNNAAYLEDAVRSVLNQDYPNLEIIVLDDASTDNTAEVTAALSTNPRITCHKNETNLGRVATYRKCLYELAKGDWYLNLDGDDYLTDPYYISKAVGWISQQKNVVMVTGAVERLIDGKLHYVIHSDYGEELSCVDGKDYFLNIPSKKTYFSHLATLYHRQKAMELGFYGEDIISADYESLYRLVLTGNVISYDKVVGVWRIHGGNETIQKINSVDQIMKNFTFIEKPALFAQAYLDKAAVHKWRTENLVIVIESYIAKTLIERPSHSFSLLARIFGRYPGLFIRACWNMLVRKAKKGFGAGKGK